MSRTIYIEWTDTDGKKVYREHQVWDAEIFMQARKKEAQMLNEKAKNEKLPAQASVRQITRDEYKANRK